MDSLAQPLTKKQRKEIRNLTDDELREYLQARFQDEAEVWVEYFMNNQQDLFRRFHSSCILRPGQM